jgi:hypothetical protein
MDRNLRLALIDEVYSRRHGDHYWLGTLRQAYEAKRPALSWESFEAQDEPAPELEELVLGLPLASDELASIEQLTLDGDRDVYTTFPSWWDFGDHFTIHDLAGIEACTRLAGLSLGQGLVEGASLAPLRRLPALATLSLCTTCDHRDLDALLDIPALKRVEIYNLHAHEPWHGLVAKLRARGIVAGGP